MFDTTQGTSVGWYVEIGEHRTGLFAIVLMNTLIIFMRLDNGLFELFSYSLLPLNGFLFSWIVDSAIFTRLDNRGSLLLSVVDHHHLFVYH